MLFIERIILSNSIPFLITQSVNNHFINYFGSHCNLPRIQIRTLYDIKKDFCYRLFLFCCMSKIEIKDLYLVFGNEKQKALKMLKEGKTKSEILKATGCTVAVKDANLSINEGEIFVIMGLSGSGKSTLLRCINRLIRPTSGEVIINGTDIAKVSDKELLQIRRKELAMVFQNFGLLPHRSVLHNIAFGLELQGVKKGEREKKAMESMQLVGLKGYEKPITPKCC